MSAGVSGLELLGYDSDPDGDGVSNFVEYAFRTNPAIADGIGGFIRIEDNVLRFDGVSDGSVVYQLFESSDLTDWSPSSLPVEKFPLDENTETSMYVLPETNEFYRVLVSEPSVE